jgi:hypothetical protein
MNLKDRINVYEDDAKLLESIASGYDEASREHAAIKRAAVALWYALTDNYDQFKDYVEKLEGDLSPKQRAHLAAMGIDPDLDPDANKSR